MSSWIKGIAGGSSGTKPNGGKSGGRDSQESAPGFFSKTQDKNRGPSQAQKKQGNGHQQEEPGFKQKMFQYGMDVQGKRDQQRKEQEIIEKKMQKRGQRPSSKADVPNNTSKVKLLTNLVGKSK